MNGPLGSVLRYVERLASLSHAGDQSDGQLLERFTSERDESALVTLMQRHGPLVWSVCQRLLPNIHDAEDAFQATFIVLTRKAASLERRPSLAGWLYEVAQRTALQTRALVSKRRLREWQAAATPSSESDSDVDREHLKAVLDAELNRLPDRYRNPVILCDLQGKSHLQAAQELGMPSGSVSRRLARGRELLRERLVRCGVTTSIAALPAVLAEQAARAQAPAHLIEATRSLLTSISTPAGVKAGLIAEGVLRAMYFSKLRIATVILIVVTLTAASSLAWHVAVVPIPDLPEDNVPRASKPVIKDGLSVTVTPTKAVFASAEAPSFLVEFKNVSNKSYFVYPADLFYQWRYTLVQKQGAAYKAGAIWRKPPPGSVGPHEIAPGKVLVTTATIGSMGGVLFQFTGVGETRYELPAGDYSVTIAIDLQQPAGQRVWRLPFWTGVLETKPARFKISKKPLPAKEDASNG